jgi:hypothetical protein
MTSAKDAYAGGQRRPMAPRSDTEFATQLRPAIWKATTGLTAPPGPARDKALLRVIRNHYPKALDAFPEEALLAAGTQLAGGACSWCALRLRSALAGKPTPRPSEELRGLLGEPCRKRCRPVFDAQQVAKRERATLAASGQPRPVATPPATAPRKPANLPPFYGSQRVRPRR